MLYSGSIGLSLYAELEAVNNNAPPGVGLCLKYDIASFAVKITPFRVTYNVSKVGSSKSPSGESSSSQIEVGWMTPALAKTRSMQPAVL